MQARQACPAESSSSSYGLVVHLLLLSTPPLGDAVAFSFRPESVCLKRTSTSLTSRALRRTYHRLPVVWCFNFSLKDGEIHSAGFPSLNSASPWWGEAE